MIVFPPRQEKPARFNTPSWKPLSVLKTRWAAPARPPLPQHRGRARSLSPAPSRLPGRGREAVPAAGSWRPLARGAEPGRLPPLPSRLSTSGSGGGCEGKCARRGRCAFAGGGGGGGGGGFGTVTGSMSRGSIEIPLRDTDEASRGGVAWGGAAGCRAGR